jgi:ATP-independent RNA helicase DbpA
VINYQIARDLEVHVHRIGRTGRAGNKGIACTLFAEGEHYKFQSLEEYLQQSLEVLSLPPLKLLDQPAYEPAMATLQIGGGKKQKVRPGDILGALTGKTGNHQEVITGDNVGKINIYDNSSYVAVSLDVVKAALNKLEQGKLKGRSFRVRRIRS